VPARVVLHEFSFLKSALTIKDFTIFKSIDRLKVEGDLFKDILTKGIDLEKSNKKAQSILKA